MSTPVVSFIEAAAQYGFESIRIKPRRSLGPIEAQVVLEETHHDEVLITEHPVEQGARIADHAIVQPAQLILRLGWSNTPTIAGLAGALSNIPNATLRGVQSLITGNSADSIRDVYQKLLKLHADRQPFEVFTGKRIYKSMLIQALTTSTDNKTENSLVITVKLQQVILVTTRTLTVSAPPANQRNPEATASRLNNGVKQLQPAPNYNFRRDQ